MEHNGVIMTHKTNKMKDQGNKMGLKGAKTTDKAPEKNTKGTKWSTTRTKKQLPAAKTCCLKKASLNAPSEGHKHSWTF